jgi:hypothetical protein
LKAQSPSSGSSTPKINQKPYTGGDIAEFAKIAEKTYANSRFLAKILLLAISPKMLNITVFS